MACEMLVYYLFCTEVGLDYRTLAQRSKTSGKSFVHSLTGRLAASRRLSGQRRETAAYLLRFLVFDGTDFLNVSGMMESGQDLQDPLLTDADLQLPKAER